MPESLDALKQVAPGLIRKMKPQEVSNTLYGYASLSRTATDDTRDTAMSKVPLAELEEAIERVAPDMNSQNVANTVWAYGTLGVPPSALEHVAGAAWAGHGQAYSTALNASAQIWESSEIQKSC